MWTFCGGRRVSFNIPQCLKATGTQYGPKPWFSSGFYAFFTIYYFPLLLPQSITTERDSTLLKNWHLLSILSFTPRSYSPSLCSVVSNFLWPHGLPGSSVHGISQASTLEWVAFPPPGDLPDPGMKFASPALAGRFFTCWATREAPEVWEWSSNSFWIFPVKNFFKW